MSEVAFYHLTKSTLEQALPLLLNKTLSVGKRALVLTGHETQTESLTDALWSGPADHWLPHGSAKDGFEADQPIYISETADQNPNGAAFLFLTDGVDSDQLDQFERCFVMFDGRNPSTVQNARLQWKAYKTANHTLTYWQQTDQGGWEKKA